MTMSQAQPAPEPRDDGLSYGVELEFLVFVKEPKGSRAESREQARKDVSEALKEIPGLENVACFSRDVGVVYPELSTPLVENPKIKKAYHYWVVKDDLSIKSVPGSEEEATHLGIEIASAVLYAGADDKVTTEDRQKVRNICKAIRDKFNTRINVSCGLHVHVGEQGKQIGIETARRLVTLLWAAEPIIVNLVAPWRKLSSHSFRKLTDRSSFALKIEKGEDILTYEDPGSPWPQKVRDMVAALPGGFVHKEHLKLFEAIGSMDEHELAQGLLNQDRVSRTCVSFLGVAPRVGMPHPQNTIESRYMQGSLDPDFICDNAELWLAMYRAVRSWDDHEFAVLFADVYLAAYGPSGQNYDFEKRWEATEKLFTALGLEDRLPQWKAAVDKNKRTSEFRELSPIQ